MFAVKTLRSVLIFNECLMFKTRTKGALTHMHSEMALGVLIGAGVLIERLR